MEWILRFPSSRIHHLDAFHSNHKPLLLCFDFEFNRFYKKGKPFRFESMWLKENSCETVIWESWGVVRHAAMARDFIQKIDACQENLKAWNRKAFGHVWNTLRMKLA